MSTYRRKAQPTIEAIRLPRPMQLLDGHDRRGLPVFIMAEAGDYLVVEGEQYYILTADEFAAQFEEDAQSVIHHRKPQHVQGETTVTPWWGIVPNPTVTNPSMHFTGPGWTDQTTATRPCFIEPPDAGKAL